MSQWYLCCGIRSNLACSGTSACLQWYFCCDGSIQVARGLFLELLACTAMIGRACAVAAPRYK